MRNLDPAKIKSSKKFVCQSEGVEVCQISDALKNLIKDYNTKK